MTTELDAPPILPDSRRLSRTGSDIRPTLGEFEFNQTNLQESSPDTPGTGASTPIDPLQIPNASEPINIPNLVDDVPRPRLVKARTTGDYVQHLHDRAHRQLLIANGGPLAVRRLSFDDDYGLDELRAPPILPDRPRRKSLEVSLSRKPKKSLRKRLRDDFIVGCWITFLSIWGALARIGLSALSTYPGQPVFPLIWSQFIGCAVMGFLLQDKTLFPKDDRYVPLYIGLTTGFCGSLTSFSSFMWNSFQALANLDPFFERSRGRNVLALFSQVVITLCVSIAALRFGAHCAQVTKNRLPSIRQSPKLKRYLHLLGVSLGVSAWATAGIMTGLISKWRPQLWTCVFAPAGTDPLRDRVL
jgi:fluoride ion exporter CrcB/FEX